MTPATERAPAAERLRTLRRTYARRGEAWGGKDIAYLAYATVLLAAIVAVPLLRGIVLTLAAPEAIATLHHPRAPAVVAVLGAALLAALTWLGRLRGPVILQPFFVPLLAGTDLPRSLTLRRTFLANALLVTAAGAGVGLLFAGVLIAADPSLLTSGIVFVLGCVCLGLLGSVCWLAGQHLPVRSLWLILASLAGGAGLVWLVPTTAYGLPWGWFGLLWPAGRMAGAEPLGASLLTDTALTDLGQAGLLLIGLVAAATVALWRVPGILNALDSSRLLRSAQRWQSAGTAAASGNIAYAVGSFRALPSIGRRWTAVAADSSPGRFLRRDLVATARTPGRMMVASSCLVVAWVMIMAGATASASIAWLPAATGSAIAYLALGVFSDGFRHAAEAAAAPPLYGYGTARLYLLHALLPALVAVVTALAGAMIAVVAGAPIPAVASGAMLVPVLVLIRAFDSAKGDLPLILLTPMPTAGGDMSGVMVLAWQADALLIAAVAGAGITAMVSSGPVLAAAGAALVVALVLTRMLRTRLSRL